MTPRFQFSFDEPHGDSIGDRLIAEATMLEIRMYRRPSGVTAMVKLESVIGCDFLREEGDPGYDADAETRKSFEALADVRKLVAAFADRRQDGAA